MDSDQASKTWTCKNCEQEFAPELPNYNCPKCGSTKTVPTHVLLSIHKKEEDDREASIKLAENSIKMQTQSLNERLASHFNGIGVEATFKTINDSEPITKKGVLSEIKSFLDTVPTTAGRTIASIDLKGKNIDHVQIIEKLRMEASRKETYSHRTVVYIHRYVVNGDISGLKKDVEADTEAVKEGGFFSRRTVDLKWIDPSGGGGGRLVDLLNADTGFRDVLFKLGLFESIGVFIDPDDGKVGINNGVGKDEFGFPSREVFEVFDKLAGYVRSVMANKTS
jgi:hypothetical protein